MAIASCYIYVYRSPLRRKVLTLFNTSESDLYIESTVSTGEKEVNQFHRYKNNPCFPPSPSPAPDSSYPFKLCTFPISPFHLFPASPVSTHLPHTGFNHASTISTLPQPFQLGPALPISSLPGRTRFNSVPCFTHSNQLPPTGSNHASTISTLPQALNHLNFSSAISTRPCLAHFNCDP